MRPDKTHTITFGAKAVRGFAIGLMAAVCPVHLSAETVTLGTTTYGTVGLVEMPTAQSAPDAELSVTASHAAGSTRGTLSFQITPRLSGSFRYSRIQNWTPAGDPTFDRSFDLRYRIMDEGSYRPAVAIGLQDFIGTGIYSGEYIVATKHLTPNLTITGGLGWGRFATHGGFQNPLAALSGKFATRPTGFTGTGGQLESAKWFRGDAAFFGGVAWQATDQFALQVEYSSDGYARESAPRMGLIDYRTPVNLGLEYRLRDNLRMKAYLLHGSEVGISLTAVTNPTQSDVAGGKHSAPLPVLVRAPANGAYDLGWAQHPDSAGIIEKAVSEFLAKDGMELEAIQFTGRSATVHIRNTRYLARSEAIGRTARALTYILPPSVEMITIVPVENGMAASAITISRTDLEQLEHDPDGAWRSFTRARISDAAGLRQGSMTPDDLYPRFRWSLGPSVSGTLFDPDQPFQVNAGVSLSARYDAAPGFVVSGDLAYRLFNNFAEFEFAEDDPVLPRVRSNARLYADAPLQLGHLTAAWYMRPAPDFYGRLTIGYLEPMYAGVSGELLWKPVDSRLALGVELNHVRQRAYQGLGLRDYQTTTGHLSAYYDFNNDFHVQLDMGRYLAGDWGGTLSIDREFDNGWRVGAYATLTNVSFEDFGEGSFDKGIRITMPLGHFLGDTISDTRELTLQPILRDGGARVQVDGRLYETVRSYHSPDLRDSWGRFWR